MTLIKSLTEHLEDRGLIVGNSQDSKDTCYRTALSVALQLPLHQALMNVLASSEGRTTYAGTKETLARTILTLY